MRLISGEQCLGVKAVLRVIILTLVSSFTILLTLENATPENMAVSNDLSDDEWMPTEARLGIVGDYHQRTKHKIDRLAEGSGEIDWSHAPATFSWFEGCDRIQLPLRELTVIEREVSLRSLSVLLLASLALSGVKRGFEPYFVRTNPSSGNLHPIEATIVMPAGDDQWAAYHYNPHDHALEKRASFGVGDAVRLVRTFGATTCSGERYKPALAIALSAACGREEWKYGARGWRYCQLDAGHAIAAVSAAAEAMGWSAYVLSHLADSSFEDLIGIDNTTLASVGIIVLSEPPKDRKETMCSCNHHAHSETTKLTIAGIRAEWVRSTPKGRPTSARRALAASIERATRKPETQRCAVPLRRPPKLESWRDFVTIARKRRTAHGFDSTRVVEEATLYELLEAAVLDANDGAWVVDDALALAGSVHLAVFVGAAASEDLQPGLYLALRDAHTPLLERFSQNRSLLRLRPNFYRVVAADVRHLASPLACDQGVASQAPLVFVAIGDFGPVFFGDALSPNAPAPWRYKSLLREAGILAHHIVLQAQKRSLAAATFGCFFDDLDHAVLGLGVDDHRFQALYHIAIGEPLPSGDDDKLLQNRDPYELTRDELPSFLKDSFVRTYFEVFAEGDERERRPCNLTAAHQNTTASSDPIGEDEDQFACPPEYIFQRASQRQPHCPRLERIRTSSFSAEPARNTTFTAGAPHSGDSARVAVPAIAPTLLPSCTRGV